MRHQIWSVMCAAALFSATIAIAAQQPPPARPPVPPPSPATAPPSAQSPPATPSDSADKITVTGCLQAVPQGPTGTAGTADAKGGSSAGEKFMLTNVTPAAKEASAPATSVAKTYRLIANEAALAPHIGKKLEVTGTLDGQTGAAGGAGSASAGATGSAANAPKLALESGKIIAPSCAD
jgi:hypothetical protein